MVPALIWDIVEPLLLVAVGYFADEIKEYIRKYLIYRRRIKRIQELANQLRKDLELLGSLGSIEIVSILPKRNILDETEEHKLPVDIEIKNKSISTEVRNLISKYEDRFRSRLTDGEIIGVIDVIPRRYERDGYEEPELYLLVRPVRYYHFLVTNANIKLRNDLNEEDKKRLLERLKGFNRDHPDPFFANPLSVEVLLLCDNGRKMVLQRRSSGTVFRSNMIYPSVAETVSANMDRVGNKIDILRTIYRGLHEELGIGITNEYIKENIEEIIESVKKYIYDIHIMALLFDREVYDYKFAVVAETALDEELILKGWKYCARDAYESNELIFENYPLNPSEMKTSFIRDWSPEAQYTYITSILINKGLKFLRRHLRELNES